MLTNLIKLLRPQQWLKNSFIWIGIFFGHAWNNLTLVYQVVGMTIAFCLVSSSVYIINDLFDRAHDQLHPRKKYRPIAAGVINIKTAIIFSLLLMVTSLTLGFYISLKAGMILVIYLILNFLYSYHLKNIVILDVFLIATGFMLRILAGTYGIGIPPSHWLMLCGMLLTLFLGFTKRRAELNIDKSLHRKVLQDYSVGLLNSFIIICASGVIVSYSLYTLSPATIQTHHTNALIYTVPLVIYGIFRYLYLLYNDKLIDGQDISNEIFKDKQLLIVIIGWFLATLIIFA